MRALASPLGGGVEGCTQDKSSISATLGGLSSEQEAETVAPREQPHRL